MRLTLGFYIMSTIAALIIAITGTLGQKGDRILEGVAMYVSFLRLFQEEITYIYNPLLRPFFAWFGLFIIFVCLSFLENSKDSKFLMYVSPYLPPELYLISV